MTDVRGNVPFAETLWRDSSHGCFHFFAKGRKAQEFREVERTEGTRGKWNGNVGHDVSRFQSARQCVRHQHKSELRCQPMYVSLHHSEKY